MRENVAQQGVYRRDDVGSGDREVDGVVGAQYPRISPMIFCEHGPEREPIGEDVNEVGLLHRPRRRGAAGAEDDGVDLGVEGLDGLAHPVGDGTGGQRVGVEPQCGQRGAQPV